MADDIRRHRAPVGGETPKRQAINDLSLTINDIVPVANTTERAQLVADLTTAGFPPSATRPLYVHRADAPAGQRVEVTTDGTTWPPLAHGTLLSYTLANDASGFNTTRWSTALGTVTIPTTRIRVTLSGVVNVNTSADSRASIALREGSASSTAALATLRVRPAATGGPGQVTWTAVATVTVTPGDKALYLTADRDTGSGTLNLISGFTVLIETDI